MENITMTWKSLSEYQICQNFDNYIKPNNNQDFKARGKSLSVQVSNNPQYQQV